MNGKWTKENFEKFDAEHPELYQAFKKIALRAALARSRYSARGIFHIIRWESLVSTGTDYKIDDGWSPHYARKFMAEYPEHGEFFETRTRKHSYHKQELEAA